MQRPDRSRRSARGARRRGRARARPSWVGLPDARLLDLRLSDLGLRIEGTPLEGRVERLYRELEARGIHFRPHAWLSDEWFSPDGVPGIAVPFYLAHPRLARLERRQIGQVEGGGREWCMKILRHEAGHAIGTAYQLHRRRRWRDLFGPYSRPYPDVYQARPYSRRFVLHLDFWYAQSHPAEDFAETFSVWLRPGSRWRTEYVGWPALRKLQYVDELMAEIRGEKPRVRNRRLSHSLSGIRRTLREHYADKRARYGFKDPSLHDRQLRRLFAEAPSGRDPETAAAFLERLRPALRGRVARATGQYRYTVDQVLGEAIGRCETLGLWRRGPEGQARTDALIGLAVLTANYLNAGYHRVAL